MNWTHLQFNWKLCPQVGPVYIWAVQGFRPTKPSSFAALPRFIYQTVEQRAAFLLSPLSHPKTRIPRSFSLSRFHPGVGEATGFGDAPPLQVSFNAFFYFFFPLYVYLSHFSSGFNCSFRFFFPVIVFSDLFVLGWFNLIFCLYAG